MKNHRKPMTAASCSKPLCTFFPSAAILPKRCQGGSLVLAAQTLNKTSNVHKEKGWKTLPLFQAYAEQLFVLSKWFCTGEKQRWLNGRMPKPDQRPVHVAVECRTGKHPKGQLVLYNWKYQFGCFAMQMTAASCSKPLCTFFPSAAIPTREAQTLR